MTRPVAVHSFAFLLAATMLCASITQLVPERAACARDSTSAAEDAALKRAQVHFRKGEKLFALGRFEDALAEYQQAFEEYPLPEFLFNIGQCDRNLGDYDEAIFSFRKYLRLKPDAENRDATEELIAELEAEKARNPSRPAKERVKPVADGKPEGNRGAAAHKPIYAKWWFWTGIVVVAGAATTAIVLANQDSGLPGSDLGNLDFSR
jgi:tetratricopeptide (TPR) repeat protein